jgi:hypothetical protein
VALPISNPNTTLPRPYRINWRQEYLHVALGLMTICWITGWVTLTLNYFIEISFPTALGLSAVNLLSSLIMVRWMMHHRASGNMILVSTMLLMWIAAGITTLAIPTVTKAYGNGDPLSLADLFTIDEQERVPGGPIIILWVLFLWWRGYQFGMAYLTLIRTSFGMRLGILGFLWVMVLAGRSLREDTLAIVPFFFFFGLLASSLARADSLNLDRARRAMGRGWILSLAGIALVVTLGGYVAALWLSGMDLGLAAKVFQTLAEGAITLLFVILSPVLFIVQIVYDFVRSIMPEHPASVITPSSGQGGNNGPVQAPWVSEMFKLLSNALMISIVIFIVLTVLAFIWFLFIARARGKDYEDEEREALGTAEVVGGLKQALRDSWRRLADALGIFRQFGLGRDFLAALTIRRIYLRMEKLAGTRGYPRALSETPYEYRRALYEAFPGLNGDVQRITNAYVAVRYGEVPENDDELTAVRTAWEHLHGSPEPEKE